MDIEPRLLAAATIVLRELDDRQFQNEHPQNIVARATARNEERLGELLYTPATFDFTAADNLDNEEVKKQIEDVLSKMEEVPAARVVEGCSCSRVEFIMKAVASKLRGSEKGSDDRYPTFMAGQLGIPIASHTKELITTVKNYVKDLNDHVRFLDSGPISTKAKNKRQPEVIARLIESIQASPMGEQQQQQETSGDAAIAGIAPAQGGSDIGTALGANGDTAVPPAATAGQPLPPPRRESQLPSGLRDSNIVLLGANAGARIRTTAVASVQATTFKLEQLMNRDSTDLSTRYPSLLTLLPQMRNQCDLAVELCTILYLELEAAMEELKSVEGMVQEFNRAAPSVVEASNALFLQLAVYKGKMSNALQVGVDIQATAGGAPATIAWASLAAGGVNPEENLVQEEQQPSSLPSSTPVGYVLQLRGSGYFGGIAAIDRIDVAVTGEGGIYGTIKVKNEDEEVALPVGSYFLLNQLFNFLVGVDLLVEPFSIWKGWTNRKSTLGKLCYSVKVASLAALVGEMKVSAGGGGKVLLLPANAVKDFFNTHVDKYPFNQQLVAAQAAAQGAGAEEGMLQGGSGAAIENREEEPVEDRGGDMEIDNDTDTVRELNNTTDPVFNDITGVLRWAMFNLGGANEEEAGSDRELAHQDDDAMDGSTATSKSQGDDSDGESHDSQQSDSLGGGDE